MSARPMPLRGGNMPVIHPDECIRCGICKPKRLSSAIVPETHPIAPAWAARDRDLELARQVSELGLLARSRRSWRSAFIVAVDARIGRCGRCGWRRGQ